MLPKPSRDRKVLHPDLGCAVSVTPGLVGALPLRAIVFGGLGLWSCGRVHRASPRSKVSPRPVGKVLIDLD